MAQVQAEKDALLAQARHPGRLACLLEPAAVPWHTASTSNAPCARYSMILWVTERWLSSSCHTQLRVLCIPGASPLRSCLLEATRGTLYHRQFLLPPGNCFAFRGTSAMSLMAQYLPLAARRQAPCT